MAVMAFAALGAYLAPAGYAAAGWMIGSAIGNALFPQKQPDQRVYGPRFGDLKVQSAAYGTMVPIVRGTMRVAGNVIWSRPVEEHEHTSVQSNGKGGGPDVVTTTYTYTVDMAVSLCEGPIAGILRIWANGELIYDASAAASTDTNIASAIGATSIRVYNGTSTQGKDSLIVADKGDANTPAYLDEAYVVFEAFDVTKYGGRPPSFEFEVVGSGTQSDLAVPTIATLGPTATGPTGGELGRNGNVWMGPDSSNRAVRANFYAGAYQSFYVPPSFGWGPSGITSAGEGVGPNIFGSSLGIFHEDGSQDVYTGVVGSIGSYAIIAQDANVLWAQGDSSSSFNAHRVVLDHASRTYTATALTGFSGNGWLVGGNNVSGRIYAQESDLFGNPPYVGYFDTATLSWVRLWNPGSVIIRPLLTRDGHIWIRSAVGATANIERRDANGVLLDTITLPETGAWSMFEDRDGLIWAVGPRCYIIHPATLDVLGKSVTFTGTFLGFTEDNRAVIVGQSAGNYVFKVVERLGRLASTPVALSSIVADICARCGLSPSEYDVTALTDNVDGFAVGRLGSGRASIEQLMIAYGFDAVESMGKVKFVKRGGSSVAVIPESDIATHEPEGQPGAPVAGDRQTESELPASLTINYHDKDSAYELGAQRAQRMVTSSKQVQSLDLPLALSADKAAQIAHMAMYVAWASRFKVAFATTRKYAHLEPTDVVQITRAGLTFTVRIESKYEKGAMIEWEGALDDPSLYTQTVVGAAYESVQSDVAGYGVTALRMLDIPLLRDADDGPGWYAAGAGYSDAWRFAVLYKSIDGGAAYDRTDTTFLSAAVIGTALTALPNFFGGNVIDALSTVDVQVNSGTLSSISDTQLLAGGNACFLGGEIVQFGTATAIGTKQYRLSRFLRGRRGTDQFMATHAVGDSFVLLDASTLKRISSSTAEIGLSRLYKAPAAGGSLDQTPAVPFTSAAIGLKPLSPVHLSAGRNSAGDVIINWTPRTRISGEWRDGADSPIGEAIQAYEVEIWDATYTTLKRTLTGISTPTVTYTSAQQVTDFGSNQATVYARVYQLSATVGRGFPRSGAI